MIFISISLKEDWFSKLNMEERGEEKREKKTKKFLPAVSCLQIDLLMLIFCSIFLFLDSTKAHLCGSKFKLILGYLILCYSYPSQTEGFNSRWMGPLCSKLKLCAWDDNINNIRTLWHHKDLNLLICQPFLYKCLPWFETTPIVAAGNTEKQKRSTLKCH